MAVRIVRTARRTGGVLKIIIGLCMLIAFGGAFIAGLGDVFDGQLDAIVPLIICILLAVSGLWLVISGVRTVKRAETFTAAPQDADAFFKMMQEQQGDLQSRMDAFMKAGPAGTYQVNRTTKRVVRTTVNGTTTTTETTFQSSDGFPTEAEEETAEVTVTCAACGGTNRLNIREIGACQYCGSRIQG